MIMDKMICPECHEPVVRQVPRTVSIVAVNGWALDLAPERLWWSHTDGEALCPVMGSDGYAPALPISAHD
jgi:hypothetical protein